MELQTAINSVMNQIALRKREMGRFLSVWNILDWSMLGCVILISFLILMGELGGSQPFAILLMLGYLYYLYAFKIKKTIPRYRVDSIEKLHHSSNNSQKILTKQNESSFSSSDSLSISNFDIQSRMDKTEKSSFFDEVQRQAHDSFFSQASFDKSSMSQNAKSMMSFRSRHSKHSELNKGERNEGKSLFQIFKEKKSNDSDVSSRKNDDYFIEMERKEKKQKLETEKKLTEMREKFDRPFLNGLKELGLEKASMEKGYQKIGDIFINVTRQFFEQNLENLGQIVSTLQKIYSLRVECSVIPYLRKKYIPAFEKYPLLTSQPKERQLYLSDVLQQLLTTKNSKLSIPYRTAQEKSNPMIKQSDYILHLQKQLGQHLIKRQQLDQWMHIPYKLSIEPEEIIERLGALQGYLQRKSDPFSRYNADDDSICLQEEVVFNVVRKKINSVIHKKQLQLSFEREYLFGFLKKAQSRIKIVKQNRPIGHQYHYNIEEVSLSGRKTLYNCEFGQKNTLCVIYFYLFILQKDESLWNNHSFVELVGPKLF